MTLFVPLPAETRQNSNDKQMHVGRFFGTVRLSLTFTLSLKLGVHARGSGTAAERQRKTAILKTLMKEGMYPRVRQRNGSGTADGRRQRRFFRKATCSFLDCRLPSAVRYFVGVSLFPRFLQPSFYLQRATTSSIFITQSSFLYQNNQEKL